MTNFYVKKSEKTPGFWNVHRSETDLALISLSEDEAKQRAKELTNKYGMLEDIADIDPDLITVVNAGAIYDRVYIDLESELIEDTKDDPAGMFSTCMDFPTLLQNPFKRHRALILIACLIIINPRHPSIRPYVDEFEMTFNASRFKR